MTTKKETFATKDLLYQAFDRQRVESLDLHALLSLCDFIGRFVVGISWLPDVTKLGKEPGPGEIRRALGAISKRPGPEGDWAKKTHKTLSAQLPSVEKTPRDILSLRHHLFHGGRITPKGSDTTKESIRTRLDDLYDYFINQLSETEIVVTNRTSQIASIELVSDSQKRLLAPFLWMDRKSRHLVVIARISAGGYICHSTEGGAVSIPRDVMRGIRMDEIFRTTLNANLTKYCDDVVWATEAFGTRAAGCDLIDSGGFEVNWEMFEGPHRRTRLDRFRLGPENARQWLQLPADPGGSGGNDPEWVGYTSFLKEIASWEELAKRFSDDFRKKQEIAAEELLKVLPLKGSQAPPRIEASFEVDSMQAGPHWREDKFLSEVEQTIETSDAWTQLYFVHAEAGAGKTTLLESVAAERAEEIASNGDSGAPLFVYISSRGNVLENLDQAVDAAVAKTRLLTAEAVKVLAHAGLVVPIIDGFDELVGTPAYGDALGSLRPWIETLGGRGALVVSARSNYYLESYKRSLAQSANSGLPVRHTILKLCRWEPSERDRYFEAVGLLEKARKVFSDDDLQLLRTPFFSRVAVSFLSQKKSSNEGLRGYLVEQYALREQEKLRTPDAKVLVSNDELCGILEEVASEMASGSTRTASFEVLRLATEATMEQDLSERPLLLERLPSLCGIDIAGSGGMFAFSHEVLFDYFLGAWLKKRWSEYTGKKVLTTVRLPAGSIRVLGALEFGAVAETAQSLSREHPANSVLSENLGAIWENEFRQGRIPSKWKIENAIFNDIGTDVVSGMDLTFVSCEFSRFCPSSDTIAHLVECKIDTLQFGSGKFPQIHLTKPDLSTVLTPSEMAITRNEIVAELKRLEVAVNGLDAAKKDGSQDRDDWEFFLRRLDRDSAYAFVLNEDFSPADDPKQRWPCNTRGKDAWVRFIRVLKETKSAELKNISASGSKKLRLHFQIPPRDLLAGRTARSQAFWGRAE